MSRTCIHANNFRLCAIFSDFDMKTVKKKKIYFIFLFADILLPFKGALLVIIGYMMDTTSTACDQTLS